MCLHVARLRDRERLLQGKSSRVRLAESSFSKDLWRAARSALYRGSIVDELLVDRVRDQIDEWRKGYFHRFLAKREAGRW